jgi:hypothetical protein
MAESQIILRSAKETKIEFCLVVVKDSPNGYHSAFALA